MPRRSRYQVYKEKNDIFTNWVLDTAAPKMKKRTPSLQELENMVSEIKTRGIPPPEDIRTALNIAIVYRKRAMEFFQRVSPDHPKLVGHRYIIDCLHRCQSTMESLHATQVPRCLSNRFEHLSLELADSAVSYDREEVKDCGSLPTVLADSEFEPHQNRRRDAERRNSLFALLEEVDEIRQFIVRIWERWGEQKTNTSAAAMATEAGFGEYQRMCAEIEALISEESTFENVFKFCHLPGVVPIASLDDEGMLGWPGYSTFVILNHLLQDLDLDQVLKNGFARIDVAQLNLDLSKAQSMAFEREQATVASFLAEVIKLEVYDVRTAVPDRLTYAVQSWIHSSHTVPSPYLVFCFRSFLDVHHLIGSQRCRPFEELRAVADTMGKSILNQVKHSISNPLTCMEGDSFEQTLRNGLLLLYEMILTWALRDGVESSVCAFEKAEIKLGKDLRRRSHPEEYNYLYLHPTAVGLMIIQFHELLKYWSLHYCNEWGAVMIVLHLVNAAEVCKLWEANLWPELESAKLESNKTASIFLNNNPVEMSQLGRLYALAHGAELDQLTKHQRSDLTLYSTSSKQRRRIHRGPVSQTLFTLLEKKDDIWHEILPRDLQILKSTKLRNLDDSYNNRDLSLPRSTAVDTMALIESSVMGAAMSMQLDYSKLHIQCFAILSAVITMLEERLTRCAESKWSKIPRENSTHAFYFVGFCIMEYLGDDVLAKEGEEMLRETVTIIKQQLARRKCSVLGQ